MSKQPSIRVYHSSETSRYEVSADGVYLGPAEDLLRFVYGAVAEQERDRLLPIPGIYLKT